MPKTRCLLIGLAVSLSATRAEAAAPVVPAKKAELVRKLTVNIGPVAAQRFSAKPGVTVVSDQKELTEFLGELLGEAAVKQIAAQIDFAKEKLAHVAWGSSGPPSGTLQHEVKQEKGDAITFYIKEPKAPMRGVAYRLGSDFFVVPKKSQVSFGGAR